MKFYFRKFIFLAVITGGFSMSCCEARELQVSRNRPGAYTTIQQAIDAAEPGDVIKLDPQESPYYEEAVFHDRSGTEQQPITLDGQGAVLNGSEVLHRNEWEQISPGLYRSTAFAARVKVSSSLLTRYYFIFDGTINRMGRASKSKGAALPPVEALKTGEWTYAEAERAFFVRPTAGLESVRAPMRANGVTLSGNCGHLRIRNITATWVWNDGFNIHNRSRDVIFENIKAIGCGDDGISAHEDCHMVVDGLLSRDNATGFCHIGQSQIESRNVRIEDCLSYGIFLTDQSRNSLQNCIIRSDRGYALRLTSQTHTELDNVLLIGTALQDAPNFIASPLGVVMEAKANVLAARISVLNMPFTARDAAVRLSHSAIACPTQVVDTGAGTSWSSNDNVWDIAGFNWNGTTYGRDRFDAYCRASGQDSRSRSETIASQKLLQGQLTPYGIELEKLSSEIRLTPFNEPPLPPL
jgi:hypothetical protein